MSSEKSKTLKKIKGSNHILHPDSGLVLRSAKERIVIGRFENNEITPLDAEAISLSDANNFEYDKSLLNEDGDDEAEAEEEVDEGEASASATEEEGTDTSPEPVVQPEHVEKPATTVKVSGKDSIVSHLGLFSENHSNLLNNLSKTVSDLENSYLTKITTLENDLASKSKDYDDMKTQFDSLNAKFQGIKSLFS